MLLRTHLAIAICAVLVLLSVVEDKLIFVLVVLVATFIPDVDSRFSSVGQKKVARVLQFFTKHRGWTHSFVFVILITVFFALFFPVVAFGFFLGWGLHLLADSFTVSGIMPFYPLKYKSKGWIRTGGKSEIIVFVFFIILDLVLVLWKFGVF